MRFRLRTATMDDKCSINSLIAVSARGLGIKDYTVEQIEGALHQAWGLDSQLILDSTYFVVESENILVGCGGWSFRETLFGNDIKLGRSSKVIEPNIGPAKIRAFFVHPAYARQGIGSKIMHKCEQEALRHGYRQLELMATLSGQKLYEKHGFVVKESIDYPVLGGLNLVFIRMEKEMDAWQRSE